MMNNSSSESDSQRVGQYSTPQGVVEPLSCSISSISDERPQAVKKALSRSIYKIRYTDNQNEDADGVFGDAIRDYADMPEDIQSVGIERLFHRAHDVAFQKTVSEPYPIFKVPMEIPLQHTSDDNTFDGKLGDHHRTYSRIARPEKKDFSDKEEFAIYSKADFLWGNFMGYNTSLYYRKNIKPMKNLPVKSATKFFNNRQLRSPPEQPKTNNSDISYSGLLMPSLKRPLGWMAIKGFGYAERLKLSNEIENFPEDLLNSNEPNAKRKRN